MENYFEEIVSQCRMSNIKLICLRYTDLSELKKSIKTEWGSYKGITEDSRLLCSLEEMFQYNEFLNEINAAGDFKEVYDRCIKSFDELIRRWRNNKGLAYESLFDVLVDLNWVVASVDHCEKNYRRKAELLIDYEQIRWSLLSYLDSLYVQAIKLHNESVYIGEGITAKEEHPYFPSRYMNRYRESERYISSEYNKSELISLKSKYKHQCIGYLAVYYGLTVTSALEKNILKGVVR